MGNARSWYDRLPHFKMGFTPRSGEELQSEFFVPNKNSLNTILAIEKIRDKIHPHLMTTEIRTIVADDFWMTLCYKQACVAIHLHENSTLKTLAPYDLK